MTNIALEDLEVEIKIQVEEGKLLEKWLDENANFIKEANQEDHYYQLPEKPFKYLNKFNYIDGNEWFRVRLSETGDNINYKKNHSNENETLLYSDEIETGVEDGRKVIDIIKALGYEEIAVVKKHRRTYKYEVYEFVLDYIEELGHFVEIEYQGEMEDLEQGRKIINDFIKSIGITKYKEVNTGYPQMFWNDKIIYIEND